MRGAWVGFVSRRWFAARRESGGAAPSALAAAGIGTGVAALIVVLGVMNGFQLGFIDSILEIASFHLRVEGDTGASPDGTLVSRLANESGVRSVLPFKETRCLIVARDGRSQPLLLRVLPPDASERDTRLAPALGLRLPLFAGGSGIVLGGELARYLNLAEGDDASLTIVETGGGEGVEAKSLPVRIAGSFRSGYFEYDFGTAFMSATEADALHTATGNPWTYGVKLADRWADLAFAARLGSAYGLGTDRVQGWRDYNRAFFSALRTEKTVMMLLVGLIFLVVGVNIYHAMRRTVAERMEDIAVLRALGAGADSLRRAFLLDGLAVGMLGSAAGLIVGLAVAVNVNEVFAAFEWAVNAAAAVVSRVAGDASGGDFRVFSPQYFYLMEVPVRLLFPEMLFIVAAAVAAATAAAGAAAARVSRMAPAEVLRHE